MPSKQQLNAAGSMKQPETFSCSRVFLTMEFAHLPVTELPKKLKTSPLGLYLQIATMPTFPTFTFMGFMLRLITP